MKNRWLILPLFILIIVFILIPLSTLSADPGNLVKNGDFSDGSNHWSLSGASIVGGEALVDSQFGYVYQVGISTSNKNIIYSVDVSPITYGSGGFFRVAFNLNPGGTGYYDYYLSSFPTGVYSNISFTLEDAWGGPLPDFNNMEIFLQTFSGCQVYCDNFSLIVPGVGSVAEPPSWVRTMPMMCQYVWINEDGHFQFKFLYPYADNNWVKIYKMKEDGTAGEEVFVADMPHMNPNLIVDLPDGIYIVMTFHDDMANSIQTFVIGKPAPDMEM